MNFEAGALLTHSYRLLYPLGEGGMGCVWMAEHIELERRVAIKVMSEAVLATPTARELFRREARATARIDHPNVVRVLDFDVTDEGVPFLVLELLVGDTLEERLVRDGALTLAEATMLVRQMCHALAAAHACGILHRDIKAENVVLLHTPRGSIDSRLLDFGIALPKNGSSLGLVGPLGTPQYMSPEQLGATEAGAARVDERSDLFSVGICVYYALTGTFPFEGDTVSAISVAQTRRMVAASGLRPDLPPALDTWFSRALARDPAARFQSAVEMYQAFEASLVTRPTHDTPVVLEVDVDDTMHAGLPRKHAAIWWSVGLAMIAAAGFTATHPTRLEAGIAWTYHQVSARAVMDDAPIDVERPFTLGASPFARAFPSTELPIVSAKVELTPKEVTTKRRPHIALLLPVQAPTAAEVPAPTSSAVAPENGGISDFGGRE